MTRHLYLFLAVQVFGPWAGAQVLSVPAASAMLPGVISIKEFNCIGDDQHDDSACFVAAREYVQNQVREDNTPDADANKLGGVKIYVPPGTYLITQPRALMSDSFVTRTYGYKLEGAGSGLSVIDYRPATEGPLLSNRDAFIDVHISGLTFTSNSRSADFLDSYSTGGAQSYLFSDVNWRGRWDSLFRLTGTDTNSEWDWDHVLFLLDATNVLYIGSTGTSDQFLNYWFRNSRISLSHGNFINAYKGGHFKITNCDFSGLYGSGDPLKPDILFALRGTVHASGVTHFECQNSRFELKTDSIVVLYSEWGSFGEVSFEDDDFSSQQPIVKFQPIKQFEINMAHSAGAARYNFVRSHLMGFVQILYSNFDWGYRRNVSFEDVQFVSFDDYSQGVRFRQVSPAGSNYGGIPIVECIRCLGGNSNIFQQKQWEAFRDYPPRSRVFSAGYLYETPSGGRSGNNQPHGRAREFNDGAVVWSTVDEYWGSDYVQNAELRPSPYLSNGYSGTVKIAIASDQNNLNYLPHRISQTLAGFSRIILPPYATILKIQLVIVPGSSSQKTQATFTVRDDAFVSHVFFSHVLNALNAGDNHDFPLVIPHNVGTDIGSRTIVLEAAVDVAQGAQGWFLVSYI